jgi:hypothetical protein
MNYVTATRTRLEPSSGGGLPLFGIAFIIVDTGDRRRRPRRLPIIIGSVIGAVIGSSIVGSLIRR